MKKSIRIITLMIFVLFLLSACGKVAKETGSDGGSSSGGNNYTLSHIISPNATGTVTLSPAGGSYASGTIVILTATANSGYVFDHWEGDVSSNTSPLSISMNNNKSFTAVFRVRVYSYYPLNINISPNIAGSVNKNPNNSSYLEGTTVGLTCNPNPGYIFDHWEGDLSGNGDSIVINSTKNITAVFSKKWTLLGTLGVSAYDNAGVYVKSPSIVIYQNNKYVSYIASDSKAYVKLYNGTSWQSVGSSISDGSAGAVSLYIFNGIPYVAYIDGANGNKATVKRFDGSNWVLVGSAGFSLGNIASISLYVYNNNGTPIPYVAFSDISYNNRLTVMNFPSSNWQIVGTEGISLGTAYFVTLQVYDNAGSPVPYVAFEDEGNGRYNYLFKYSGSSWVQVGDKISNSAGGNVSWLCFYLDQSSGNPVPYVAFKDWSNNYQLAVRKFNGTAWEDIGASSLGGIQPQYTSVFVYQGTPYVAYQTWVADENYHYTKYATVKKFFNGNWESVGYKYISEGNTTYTSLFVNNNLLDIVYADDLNGGHIVTVMEYQQ